MKHVSSRSLSALLFCSVCGTALVLNATPPPEPKPEKPTVDRRATTGSKMKVETTFRMELHKNFVNGRWAKSADGKGSIRVITAVDVSQVDQSTRRVVDDNTIGPPKPPIENQEKKKESPFAVWKKKFDDPNLRFSNGYASVVDEKIFTDLRTVRGKDAEKLNLDGIVIGRVKLKEYDPIQLTKFLVASGIVDANLHIEASVTVWHLTSDQGHWFTLHSSDSYWTNQYNHITYDFVLHYANDGTIRLVNPKYRGRVLKKTTE